MTADNHKKLFEISLAIARRVLPFLGKNGIPATPENYMIFYLYFEGDLPIVRQVVDAYMTQGGSWTEDNTRTIFDQLFSSEANIAFRRKNERLIEVLRQATDYIVTRSSETAQIADQTSRRLSDSMADASKLTEVNDIAEWLRHALADVQVVNEASSSLGGELTDKGREIERAVESLDRLELMALTDELTKLANRRAWDGRLRVEFNRFNRYGRPCALILLDIDDFKSVNDRFGHLAGDQALAQVSGLCQRELRTVDFIARFGGEEFTCLMPETSLDGAYVVAERLRCALAGHPFLVTGQQIGLTASFGVAAFGGADRAPEDALERADRAMYMAKTLGKNLVCGERELSLAIDSGPLGLSR